LKDRFRERVRPGPIVDDSGAVVGEHDGIAMYTVGQRSGLRLVVGGPRSQPTYVNQIDPATNQVRVGGRDHLLRSSCRVEDVRYVAGHVPPTAFAASVKVRSHAPLAPAVVTPIGDQARIDFDEPQRALAPGQAAVFYDGDRVIGGGPIAAGDV
jgi:tRNA-specific 2-thiouridylase